ncbi:MAG: hypothetical protein B9J98_04990 [Candidatus Terraquivivens tikiterensis]|uniref:Sm domain-containing protein n=1 Tax=Candidatus Terraquivivens tikiterensis TaxID=1980982 RepID=A0A2R7Y3K9_9ARCH|nr:MAG: hypothetical protein B9J98_04990 [Candidatus Terraquivivens tikiterensis]
MPTVERPLTVIAKYLNKPVKVVLKNDLVYGGMMVECDSYMNLVIDKAAEYQGDGKKVQYQKVLIRGNNIIYIQLTPVLED